MGTAEERAPKIVAMGAVVSSSGGKDSLLALTRAREAGVDVTTMLTMFDEGADRSRSHGVSRAIVEQQARALGLRFVGPSASWADYERVFIDALGVLRAAGCETAVFGDIDLQPHRDWEEKVCDAVGLRAFLPLWGEDRVALARESLTRGFRAIVVCVDSRFLDDSWAGRPFDEQFIAELPAGVDPCGENGEFHTFVTDGPGFSSPVDVQVAVTEVYVSPLEVGSQRYCFARLERR